jgi:peptide/nickel transport system permease protein
LRAGPWTTFAIRRLGRFVVSLFVLVSAAFGLIHAVPGDPVRAALGLTAPPALINATRHSLGLDRPLWRQYLDFLDGVLTGHLGTSMTSHLEVASIINARLPATVEIAALAFAVMLAISLPLGIAAGVSTQHARHARREVAFSALTGTLAAIPEFLLAVGLVFVFAVTLKVLPVAGRGGPTTYVLPVLALASGPAALLSRIVRVEMIKVLDEDYIRTARAKRLPARLIYARHALPNLLTATLTVAGLLLASLLTGTVLVENVFAWPGLGTTLVESITAKDYTVVQGLALVYGGGVLLINLAVDALLAYIDPRSIIGDR